MTSVARRLGRVVPLPNLRLTLQPPRLSRDDLARGVDEVVFRADPRVTKLEVRAYLERALRVKTTDVRTSNYDGAKRTRSRRVSPSRGVQEGVRDARRAVVPAGGVQGQGRARAGRRREGETRERARGRIDVSDARGEILRDARRRIATTTTVR